MNSWSEKLGFKDVRIELNLSSIKSWRRHPQVVISITCLHSSRPFFHFPFSFNGAIPVESVLICHLSQFRQQFLTLSHYTSVRQPYTNQASSGFYSLFTTICDKNSLIRPSGIGQLIVTIGMFIAAVRHQCW